MLANNVILVPVHHTIDRRSHSLNFFMAKISMWMNCVEICEMLTVYWICKECVHFVQSCWCMFFISFLHLKIHNISLCFLWKFIIFNIFAHVVFVKFIYLPLIFSYKWNSFIIECMLTGNLRSILYRLRLTRNLFSWGLSLVFFYFDFQA